MKQVKMDLASWHSLKWEKCIHKIVYIYPDVIAWRENVIADLFFFLPTFWFDAVT